jgi:5-methylcytosine-specific restriction endonuclease McrA
VKASHVDQGKKAEMQSTLKHKSKTHLEMLPQSPALKVSVDAPGKVKPGTIETGSLAEQAGVQHARGERPAAAGPSPFPQGKEQSGVTRVFVLSKDGTPLMPCHAARARELLAKGKAVVVRRYPFVIRLKHNPIEPEIQPVAIKLDPGAKTTGIAIVRVTPDAHQVLHLSELTYRGAAIKESVAKRAAYRRNRRSRKTRYRPARSYNRTKHEGWLPPSLQSRVDNVMSWIARYRRWCPITEIVVETVRFDTQLLVNPEINGIEYQQGTLYGYEVREYLLEKWGRKCAYCDAENVPLQIEHIQPKGRRGSDRISNLTLACHECNQRKGSQPFDVFVQDPERLKRITRQLQTPLADTAAVNATRTRIVKELFSTDLPVEVSSGGKTKFNRTRLNIPKTHALDAACTGNTLGLKGWKIAALAIKACGRGSYQRTNVNKSGAPTGFLTRKKKAYGFQTGDIVLAVVPNGKRIGTHFGRVSVRARGSFHVQTKSGRIPDISHRHCRIIQRSDGYGYQRGETAIHPSAKADGTSA